MRDGRLFFRTRNGWGEWGPARSVSGPDAVVAEYEDATGHSVVQGDRVVMHHGASDRVHELNRFGQAKEVAGGEAADRMVAEMREAARPGTTQGDGMHVDPEFDFGGGL